MSNHDEPQLTHHAMLIAWGQFAQCIGLTEQLSGVPIKQKTIDHSPQSKILEFLVANLAGLAHLKDISHAAHPLDQDLAVAQAWGLSDWADFSGVSRTLSGLKPEEVDKVLNVLAHVSQPFIDKEAALAIRQEGRLVLDGDLSGRTVSDTSRTYPGVAYGHMDDQVHLGYQAALVCLHSPTYGRLWLSVRQHPGDTVSCTEAEPMLRRSEAILGLYPMRRVDLLRKRLEALESRQKDLNDVFEKARQSMDEAHQNCDEVIRQVSELEKTVLETEEIYQKQQRKVRSYSQLSQQRARLAYYQQRQKRRATALIQAEKRLARTQKDLHAWQTEVEQLHQRLGKFERDNQSNPAPIQAIFRLDAGFGTAENIALLVTIQAAKEMQAGTKGVRAKARRKAAKAICPFFLAVER